MTGSHPDESKESMTTSEDLICGMIDVDLVRRIVGDAAIGTRGRGFTGPERLALERASCTVQNADLTQTVLQASVGMVDADRWRQRLAREADRAGDCVRYTSDPGEGYGCTYDSGVFVAGAGVNVLRDGRLIRVTVHHWPGVTAEERLATAEDIARNIDHNVATADAHHAGEGTVGGR
jgi:hypothetical protein